MKRWLLVLACLAAATCLAAEGYCFVRYARAADQQVAACARREDDITKERDIYRGQLRFDDVMLRRCVGVVEQLQERCTCR